MSPRAMARAHLAAAVVGVILIPTVFGLSWQASVTFLTMLSLVTWITGEISAWQAARVEARQASDADVKDVLVAVNRILDHLGLAEVDATEG